MIELTDEALTAVTRSYVLHTRVESWLDDELLAEDIPVASGTLEIDRAVRVPERVTINVPRLDRGVSYDPQGAVDHALAPYGQQLRLSLGVEINRGEIEWVQRGQFLVREVQVNGDTVTVEATGLLALIEEARFTTPFQPSGAFKTVIRQLVEPGLTVRFATSGLPTNRTVPSGLSWDEDRLGALEEVLDAWPADAVVTADGILYVYPAAEPTEVATILSDGVGGTVVQWSGSATRDGAANVVVARGQASDGAQLQSVAYETGSTSPLRYPGPFNPLPVPYLYFSPLLTTANQCAAAASTILARLRRSAGRMLTAQCVPHPGIETGDLVAVTGSALDEQAVVERLSLPLVAGGGAMELTLRVVDSDG